MTAVMKAAEDIEQTNADGELCIADRTKAQIKWYDASINFCGIDIAALPFFTESPIVLDYANKPVGFRGSRELSVDRGVAMEIWTGLGDGECEVPTDDSFLTSAAGMKRYGYFLMPLIVDGVMGDIEIGAKVTNLSISGRTKSAPGWGRGPYNVVAGDEDGTPSRLLTPILNKQDFHLERTPIAPPAITDGAIELDELPTPYYAEIPTP